MADGRDMVVQVPGHLRSRPDGLLVCEQNGHCAEDLYIHPCGIHFGDALSRIETVWLYCPEELIAHEHIYFAELCAIPLVRIWRIIWAKIYPSLAVFLGVTWYFEKSGNAGGMICVCMSIRNGASELWPNLALNEA